MSDLAFYAALLGEVKRRIRSAQARAVAAVNAEMIRLYWDIGRLIDAQQLQQGWGAGVIPRLAADLHNELPELKGFSERNIKRILAFYRAYAEPSALPFVPQAVAQIGRTSEVPQPVAQATAAAVEENPLWQVGWSHHALLLERVKDLPARCWYLSRTVAEGWGRDTLAQMIRSDAHERQSAVVNNFGQLLPGSHAAQVQHALKDPYLFDFLTLAEPFHERELEVALVRHLERFLVELGAGFAFVGRQYRVEVGDNEFYIDLLFYHLKLRSYVVIELKRGEFKPEYAGKLNFYCNLVDDQLRHEHDAPTIGLILCQGKDKVLAEYALRGIDKPIGVADYELTRALPEHLQSTLPTIEALEAELKREAGTKDGTDD